MLQVIIRTDASLDMGTGHVQRCLTVANALRDRNASCHFICRDLAGNMIDAINAQGYRVHVLPSPPPVGGQPVADRVPHAAWLGVDWTVDARASSQAIAESVPGGRTDWLIVDHYALDARWENAVRPRCGKLLAIDDLADRVHDCNALIDQNIGRRPEDYADLVGPDCHLITGTRNALLRPEFAALREASLRRRLDAPLQHMLISLGGIDKDNATGAVLDGLLHCDLPADLTITVVMGERAPWLDSVREQAARLPWNTQVAINVSDMAAVMAKSDIAIGAAGTTTWERCCLGLPSLVMLTAENQRYVMSQLAAQDIAVLGDVEQLRENPAQMRPLMGRLVTDRLAYSRRAAELTDGSGCTLLAEFMLGYR